MAHAAPNGAKVTAEVFVAINMINLNRKRVKDEQGRKGIDECVVCTFTSQY